MFQFSWCRFSRPILNLRREITQYNLRWVASFGISRIKACLRLPETYRCLPRPSSPHLTKSSVHKPFVAWPKFWFSRFIIVVYPQDLKKTLLLDMSTSVKLIICRNSLLLTQQKLSKNIDLRDKAQNKFMFGNFLVKINWSWAGSDRWPPAWPAKIFTKEQLYITRNFAFGGGDQNRTGDPLLAKQMLSQLSYAPSFTELI